MANSDEKMLEWIYNTVLLILNNQLNPVGDATAANQVIGNESLSNIDTKLTSQATVNKQDTGNTSLSSIDTKLSSQATAVKQDTGNTSLSNINTAIGSTSDSLASSDTATASLIAFIKREASKSSLVFSEPTVTVSTSPAYSEGDCIGGIITLSNINIAGGGAVRLESISLNENGGASPDLKFIFFKSTPSGGTYTDNQTVSWGAGDMANRVGLVKVLAANWDLIGSKAMVSNSDLNQIMTTNGTDAYLIIAAGSAYTPSSTTNLTVKLGFSRI